MTRGISHRDVTKEQFWREQIAGQPGSGLSIRSYCRRHRLRESAFYFWRKELARRGVSTEASAPFVPVRITAEHPAVGGGLVESKPPGRIEIVLSHDRHVSLVGPVDRQALADVLAVLEGQSC
jgi:hypothetical protein